MRAFLAEVDRGIITEGTFGELVEQWFEVASTTRDWSPKGIAETRRIIDTRLGPLSPIALDKLRTPIIDGYYAQLRAHGGACGHRPRQSHDGDLCEVGPPLSTATVRRIHAVIHSALEQAVAWDILMFNPASKASPGRIDSPEITSPEVDEVLKLIAAARETDPDFAVYLVVSAVTGARRGEICALRWTDFDSSKETVRFARAISIGTKGPWNGRSRRPVPRFVPWPSMPPPRPSWTPTGRAVLSGHSPAVSRCRSLPSCSPTKPTGRPRGGRIRPPGDSGRCANAVGSMRASTSTVSGISW